MASPRILLIDQHVGWLKFAEETLRQAGYVVETATDFDKAYLRYPEENFDLIFVGLDQVESHLGTITGLAKNPSHPWRFVAMFPVRQTFDRVRIMLKAGVYDVVDKPYQRDALLSTVAAMVHEARLRNHMADTVQLSKVKPV